MSVKDLVGAMVNLCPLALKGSLRSWSGRWAISGQIQKMKGQGVGRFQQEAYEVKIFVLECKRGQWQ